MPPESKSPTTISPRRTGRGMFTRGVSGNPGGRPAGSRNKSTLLLEELLHSRKEELIEKVIEQALQGDTLALKLCLERLYPVPRERRIDLPLPEVTEIAQAPAAVSKIITGIGEGEITPGEGELLTGIVERQARLLEAQQAEQGRKKREQEGDALKTELENELRRIDANEDLEGAA